MKGRDLLSLSFRVIGALFASIGAIVAASTLVFLAGAEPVAATVVDYAVEQNSITFLQGSEPTGLLYYPIVEYPAGGEEHRMTGRTGRTSRRWEPGEQLTVLVARGNPQKARINTVFGVWGSAIVLGGLGALFLLLSVLAPFGFGGVRREQS
ncbi:MAG: DUF3592 domain-containing protein [Spirochaetota bacterium]